MPNDFAERPWIGTYEKLGPDIEAPGWGQRYSSPYIRPMNPPNPDYYHGPSYAAMDVRGRHPYRTQPRALGPYVVDDPVNPPSRRPSLAASNPYYAHGLGMDANTVMAAGHAAFALAALAAAK